MKDLREQLGGEFVLAYRYEPLACDVVKVMVRLSVRLTGLGLGLLEGLRREGSSTRTTAWLHW